MPSTLWGKFFWSDWSNDPALRVCSLAAQGLWMRMLCVAAEADPTGYVTVNGRTLVAGDIARLAGISLQETETLLAELDRNGVFSRNRTGTIYSRRMVRDTKKAETARKNGKTGGNPTIRNKREIPPLVNPQVNPRDNPHLPEANSQISRPKLSVDEMTEALLKAANGNVERETIGTTVLKPIVDLLAMGCSFDDDVLPVVSRAVTKLNRPLKTWNAPWLRKEILEHRDDRKAGRLAPKPNGNHGAALTAEDLAALWGFRSAIFKGPAGQIWDDSWGPPDTCPPEFHHMFPGQFSG